MGFLHLLPLGSIGFIIFSMAKLGNQRFWINIPKYAVIPWRISWAFDEKKPNASPLAPSIENLLGIAFSTLNAILICTHPWHPANLAMPECPKIPFGLWCSGMERMGYPQHVDPGHLCHQGSFLTHPVCQMLFVLRIYKTIIHCKWFDNNLDFAHAIVHANFISYLDESPKLSIIKVNHSVDFAWLSFCNLDIAHAFSRKNLISYILLNQQKHS